MYIHKCFSTVFLVHSPVVPSTLHNTACIPTWKNVEVIVYRDCCFMIILSKITLILMYAIKTILLKLYIWPYCSCRRTNLFTILFSFSNMGKYFLKRSLTVLLALHCFVILDLIRQPLLRLLMLISILILDL